MLVHPIDHLVLPVSSLKSARARYQQLGFTVAEDRQHPFGTENACIFFQDGTYLEPIAVGDREAVQQAVCEDNVLVRQVDSFRFRHGEGFAMAGLTSSDAHGDHARIAQNCFGKGPVLEFSRKATSHSGPETTLSVRLVPASDHRAPDAMIFLCEHVTPRTEWMPKNPHHLNGVLGVTGIYMEETNPADFQYYLEVTTGQRSISATSLGIEAELPNGRVAILTPAGMAAKFGAGDNQATRGLRLRALTLAVGDLDALCGLLDANAISHLAMGSWIVVPPAPGQGAIIAFHGPMDPT